MFFDFIFLGISSQYVHICGCYIFFLSSGYPMNSIFQSEYILIRFMFLMEHFLLTFPLNYQNVYDYQTFQDADMFQGAA